jgi:hypothetical protein
VSGAERVTPSRDLIQSAVSRSDVDGDDEYWEIVRELHARGDAEVFALAAELASSDGRDRIVGLDVLGQLGFNDNYPWLDQSLPLIVEATRSDDLEVVESAITALGHLGDPRALDAILRHLDSPADEVRFSVAYALPSSAGEPADPRAVAALIALSEDRDPETRDWATFGLGSLLVVDSPKVRNALAARIDDQDSDSSGEALVGLARRKDARCFEAIQRGLQTPDVGNLIIEAAAELGDPRFLPHLERLKEARWHEDDPRGTLLEEAITNCTAEPPRPPDGRET